MEHGRLPLSLQDTAVIGPVLSVTFAPVVIFHPRPNHDWSPRSGVALRRPLVILAVAFFALFAVLTVMESERRWNSVDWAEVRLQDSRPGIEAKRPIGGVPPRAVQGVTKKEFESVPSEHFSKELQLAALTATVRIVNLSRDTQASGTIVGSNGPLTYILSAQHFLEKADRLEIHTFSKESYPQAENVVRSGKVIAELEDADLCLIRVAMRNPRAGLVRLCPPRLLPKEKAFPVLTVGCSGGDAPTCRIGQVDETQVVRKDAGTGTSLAWVMAGESARGRSGGPLIDKRGYLVGVGSGTNNGKGYYCHANEIYRFLRRNGFRWLYEHADAESREELSTSTRIRRPRNP